MQDMDRGFQIFYPYRHVRKITMFGSSRLPPDSPEYQIKISTSETAIFCKFIHKNAILG